MTTPRVHETAVTREGCRIPRDLSQSMRLRALGENLSLTRLQWIELLESLRPDSELARRIRDRLTTCRAEEIRETTGCSWESACARAELERDCPANRST